MLIRIPTNIDWYFLITDILLTLMFLLQAWENLIKKRISKFSIDALGFYLASTFTSRKGRQRALELSKDPKRIFLFGIFAILGTIGGIYETIIWFITYIH